MKVQNICRVCLAEQSSSITMLPLFDESNPLSLETVQKIELCGGVMVLLLGHLIKQHNAKVFSFKR